MSAKSFTKWVKKTTGKELSKDWEKTVEEFIQFPKEIEEDGLDEMKIIELCTKIKDVNKRMNETFPDNFSFSKEVEKRIGQ
jgi:hypothetical protein